MRLSTIASIALLAASGAALAQVASTPAEQKVTPSNTTDAEAASGTPGNVTATADPATAGSGTRDDTLANETLVLSNAADGR